MNHHYFGKSKTSNAFFWYWERVRLI